MAHAEQPYDPIRSVCITQYLKVLSLPRSKQFASYYEDHSVNAVHGSGVGSENYMITPRGRKKSY